MERDSKTGRFLTGNKIAIGNRGNRNPKWGNKNALKHGFFASYLYAKVRNDGNLYIYERGKKGFVIRPEGFIQEKDGRIVIRNDVAAKLEEMGYVLSNSVPLE